MTDGGFIPVAAPDLSGNEKAYVLDCLDSTWISSNGEFVVKVTKQRADELVASGKGDYFDPGHGRVMKQWITARTPSSSWRALAREARVYADGGT